MSDEPTLSPMTDQFRAEMAIFRGDLSRLLDSIRADVLELTTEFLVLREQLRKILRDRGDAANSHARHDR